mmetsp:Transcript_39307/g.58393  ORF Transcript_39307/g.58393 Transcript_39307/m.58393 type:complete len:126 (+) Transcript_39307:110-487(+)
MWLSPGSAKSSTSAHPPTILLDEGSAEACTRSRDSEKSQSLTRRHGHGRASSILLLNHPRGGVSQLTFGTLRHVPEFVHKSSTLLDGCQQYVSSRPQTMPSSRHGSQRLLMHHGHVSVVYHERAP